MTARWQDQRLFFPEPAVEVRQQLSGYLEDLARSAQSLPGLRALLLGGGYGRGEGGLLASNERLQLYNDLEFYVLTGRDTAAAKAWAQREAEAGHARTGIEVEFKVMPFEELRRAKPSMFYYDLLAGHLFIAGDEACLKELPGTLAEASRIPPEEGSRLLMNRGCSLLRCARAAAGAGTVEHGFIDRITAKVKLALGDALLCSRGEYHWSCRERNRRLKVHASDLPHGLQVLAWHDEAVAFKFHPVLSHRTPAEWSGSLHEIRTVWRDVFLSVEGARLKIPFASASDYADTSAVLLPGEPAMANVLRHFKIIMKTRRPLPFPWTRHPRERVLRTLVLLLNPERSDSDINRAARLLGLPAEAGGPEVEEACRTLWQQCP